MKRVLKIAAPLSWFNLILWGFIAFMVLINALTAYPPLIVAAVLLCGVPLHFYASLRLQRSLRQQTPLDGQTPSGIRFVGPIALLFGFMFVAEGYVCLRNTTEAVALMKQNSPQYAKELTVQLIRTTGTFVLVLGLITCTNVILNFRLLRWHYQIQLMNQHRNENDASDIL